MAIKEQEKPAKISLEDFLQEVKEELLDAEVIAHLYQGGDFETFVPSSERDR